MRYLITVSYDGSKFCGFQRQIKDKSVQGDIEKALGMIVGKDVQIKGAGRTDRGVHAVCQKCHFDLETKIDIDKLLIALNNRLGNYIYVKDIMVVGKDFHARFSVKEKEYVYKINMGEYDPLSEDYTYQLGNKLDLTSMKKASKYLMGKHNYSSFISGKKEKCESVINDIGFKVFNDICWVSFKGSHFYRYMIRNMMGALLEVGKGNIPEKQIKELIDCPKDDVTLPTAKPNGLYLMNIKY